MTDWRLEHIRELDEHDRAVALEIDAITGLAGRVNDLRDRARELDEALASIPKERAAVDAAGRSAARELEVALGELAAAEATVRGLERARRPSPDRRDDARRALADAEQAAIDARARVGRVEERRVALDARLSELEARATMLASESTAASDEVLRTARLGAVSPLAAAPSLATIEAWGASVRAALFVARGAFAAERERVVAEANALASSVVGAEVGATSVALLRRRVEEHIG